MSFKKSGAEKSVDSMHVWCTMLMEPALIEKKCCEIRSSGLDQHFCFLCVSH